jgi:hypothetical protein
MGPGNGTNGCPSGAALRDPELDRTRLRAIHAAPIAPVLPILQPWIERHGYSTGSPA